MRRWGTLGDEMTDRQRPPDTERLHRPGSDRGTAPSEPEEASDGHRVPEPARKAIEMIRSGVVAAKEPLVDRVGHTMDGVERAWSERPGARVRRVRRSGSRPLPNLMALHPEARSARPVQVGVRTIGVDEISGTAVGGGDQRGGDFLPLKPFRGENWAGRWQRLRQAQDRLAVLPPIDVEKYGGRYWVVDGHNRVALAKYSGQPEIDANIVELVPPGERRTEPIVPFGASAAESQVVRTAGSGHRPSDALTMDLIDIDEPDGME